MNYYQLNINLYFKILDYLTVIQSNSPKKKSIHPDHKPTKS